MILSCSVANMWAQAWGPLGDILLPYPGKPSIDITPALIVCAEGIISKTHVLIFFC